MTIKNPLEIYKILPQTNCGQCYLPTCLAFAAAVIKGDKQLGDCPPLEDGARQKLAGTIATRCPPFVEQLEEKLVPMRKAINGLDFPAIAPKLGAVMVGNRLSIKCLGKNFFVDQEGNVSSECHTHAGLTIPLLGYILESAGPPPTGSWVPFRELKNGGPMNALFIQRGEKPLKKLADTHPDLFSDLLSMFSGRRSDKTFDSDMALVLNPLPKIPILICYWQPEDDLESELNIFFDQTADRHLGIDNIFALGVGLVMMFQKIAQQHT